MDAAPAPPVTNPPALVAEATRPSTAPASLPRFVLHAGAGAGTDGRDVAGGALGAFDAFLSDNFGLGIEGELAGTPQAWDEDSDSLRAVRGRIAVRLPFPGTSTFDIALSVGVAHTERTLQPPLYEDCTPQGCEPYRVGTSKTTIADGPSFAIELAGHKHAGPVEIGGFVRMAATGGGMFLWAGPSLGFGF